jgi:hypothetical protein
MLPDAHGLVTCEFSVVEVDAADSGGLPGGPRAAELRASAP